MPTPGDTICGEIHLESLAPAALGAEVFQPVFVARDVARDERLWLAVIDGDFSPTSIDVSKFMAGANRLVGVRHPALVRVVLVDREESYCVVGYEELPTAKPLADIITRGGSRRLLARAAIEIARGLAYLHRRELLHGALTPGTVLIWEGVPVLWEYGLAALCVPEAFGPRSRSMGGDVVAPEVPGGVVLSPAIDVYAWGAVMASIASGEFGSEAVAALLDGEVEPDRQGPLLDVVRQALSPEPEQRPRDGVHLLELLQRSLAAVDPALAPGRSPGGAVAGAGEGDALSDLARRYLDEMSQFEQREASEPRPAAKVASPASPASPAAAGAAGAAGALGRVQLVRRASTEPTPPAVSRPWLAGSRRREPEAPEADETRERLASAPPSPLPEGESTDVGALPPPTDAQKSGEGDREDPDWEGRYRLPSGTYAAIRDAPKPTGDGAVRGPEPGGSGSDAGVLAVGTAPASESGSSWASRSPDTSASSWLRPTLVDRADRVVGGLFKLDRWLRERPNGLRKRWVRSSEGPPALSSADIETPPQIGVPQLAEDEDTPAEGIDVGVPSRPADERGSSALDQGDLPPSERETPPHIEIADRPEARANMRDTPRESEEVELPPMPEPEERPPADERAVAAARPFRPPRLPGPHGPPSVVMALVVLVVSGVVALGATLSASSARGGFARLLAGDGGKGSASVSGADPAGVVSGADLGSTFGPCGEGMVEIVGEDEHYCIDRAEYPGLDLVPATEVDLEHAEGACAVRGHGLCTEAQWSRACKGAAQWRYPYGPKREAGRCRVGDAKAKPAPSGTDPHCVSSEGVLDLVGNVAEWTQGGIAMGGSVRSKKSTGCKARQRLKPSTKRPTIGFRCCSPFPGESAADPDPAEEG